MGGKDLLVLPPDRLSGGKGLGHIQQPLVSAAPEAEGDVVLGLHKAAVHQHIQQAQQLVGDFAPGVAGDRPGQLLPGVAGVAPDRLFGGRGPLKLRTKGRSSRWFSGSMGSPPSREMPAI